MANKQDIITAIKNLDTFLHIPELEGAKVRLNSNGTPFVHTGGFNMVFQLTKDLKKWALRIWHVPMGNTKARYQAISAYLTKKQLPYFADFIFDEKGILVGGEFLDTIRMEWLDGLIFKEYIEENLNNARVLSKLADDFSTMCQVLRNNEISHGDLQEGNIIINRDGEIKLVDYDSVYVPSIEGEEEFITGLKGYQHPSRFKKNKVSAKADYFSELIIFLSIKAFELKPDLWLKYKVKDSCFLLFSNDDFADLKSSSIYSDLEGINSKIDALLSVLINFLDTENYADLKPFQSYLNPPEIIKFQVDKDVIVAGISTEISWEVKGAETVEISYLGDVELKGKHNLKIGSNSNILIKAKNEFGSVSKSLFVQVFPTPVMKTLFVNIPDFSSQLSLGEISIGRPKIDVSVKLDINENQSPSIKKTLETKEFLYENRRTLNLASIFQKIKKIIPNLNE